MPRPLQGAAKPRRKSLLERAALASGTVREQGCGKAEFEGQRTHHEYKSGSWTRTGTVTRMLVLESILPWWRQRMLT